MAVTRSLLSRSFCSSFFSNIMSIHRNNHIPCLFQQLHPVNIMDVLRRTGNSVVGRALFILIKVAKWHMKPINATFEYKINRIFCINFHIVKPIEHVHQRLEWAELANFKCRPPWIWRRIRWFKYVVLLHFPNVNWSNGSNSDGEMLKWVVLQGLFYLFFFFWLLFPSPALGNQQILT